MAETHDHSHRFDTFEQMGFHTVRANLANGKFLDPGQREAAKVWVDQQEEAQREELRRDEEALRRPDRRIQIAILVIASLTLGIALVTLLLAIWSPLGQPAYQIPDLAPAEEREQLPAPPDTQQSTPIHDTSGTVATPR